MLPRIVKILAGINKAPAAGVWVQYRKAARCSQPTDNNFYFEMRPDG